MKTFIQLVQEAAEACGIDINATEIVASVAAIVGGFPQSVEECLDRVRKGLHWNDASLQWSEDLMPTQSDAPFAAALADPDAVGMDPRLVEILSRGGLWHSAKFFRFASAEEWLAAQKKISGGPSGGQA